MSILQKVEKLIRHEVSARKLGSIAEADAFAAKAQQLLLQDHSKRSVNDGDRSSPRVAAHHPVTAQQAGIPALRTRQEWSERLAYGVAEAFHCQLRLQPNSNTVIFEGRPEDRVAAADLYSALAGKAATACEEEFKKWKQQRRGRRLAGEKLPSFQKAAYSRRWKQSFLIGFARTICQRFVCDHNCLHKCQHAAGLVRIGKAGCPSTETPARVAQGRAIGGSVLLYDAVYRGQAHAVAMVLDLERQSAA